MNLLKDFSKVFRENVFVIAGIILDNYKQFPKEDADTLSTKALYTHFAKKNLIVPWNIIIQHSNGHDIDLEITFLFRITTDSVVSVTLDAVTRRPEMLLEFKQLIDGNWKLIDNLYVDILAMFSEKVELRPYQMELLSKMTNATTTKLEWLSYNQLPE